MLNRKNLFKIFLLGFTSISLGNLPTASWAMEEEAQDDVARPGIQKLPEEVMLNILGYLKPKPLSKTARVSREWQRLCEDKMLWKNFLTQLGIEIKPHDVKSLVVSLLSEDTVNNCIISKKTPKKILSQLVDLGYSKARKTYIKKLRNSLDDNEDSNSARMQKLREMESKGNEQAEKGNKSAQSIEIKALIREGNPSNREAIRKLNDELAQAGDEKALERKIKGLSQYRLGLKPSQVIYPYDPDAAFKLNEKGVQEGNERAIERKIVARSQPPYGERRQTYGYSYNRKEARELNQTRASSGNERARKRALKGMSLGEYGYAHRPDLAQTANENLIKIGNLPAIKRKIRGRAYGKYGYEKDSNFLNIYLDFLKQN